MRRSEARATAEPSHPLESIKENLEAFAIAIVMALVIKHFCVEAFKIPTGSMYPTLMGDDQSVRRVGDRILVNKLAYLTSGPDRWDVIVFRYPLDKSRNFIKRVTGLPGERLRILSGDIWVKGPGDAPWRIATKPERARNELFFSVYPPTGPAHGDDFPLRIGNMWSSETPNAWRAEAYDRLEFAGGEEATLVYKRKIGDYSKSDETVDPGGAGARDVRVRAILKPEGPATVTLSWRSSPGIVCEMRLATAGQAETSALAVSRSGGEATRKDVAFVLPTGVETPVEMECVDGEAVVRVGGKEWRLPQGRRIDDPGDYGSDDQRLAIRAAGAATSVLQMRIERDLWYGDMNDLDPEKDGVQIPDDGYFMLGDNTLSSSDSRAWKKDCLVLKDGTKICWDGSTSPTASRPQTWRSDSDVRRPRAFRDRPGTLRHVTDVEGVERWWFREDEDSTQDPPSEPVPFVRRDMIVGRAFLVFWPLLPGFPHRLKFIH
jgi:signal peptidase I